MYIPIPLLPYFPKQFGKKGKSKDSYVFHASTQGESERWLQALRAAAYPDVGGVETGYRYGNEYVWCIFLFCALLFCSFVTPTHVHTSAHTRRASTAVRCT
jgi:hypothetical protein